MSGALWAVIAGTGFGVFQTINRRAVSGMSAFVATFLQLLVSAIVLAIASAATEDLSALRDAPLSVYIYFSLAGLFHFAIGWTFFNASQKRIGASRTGALIGTTPLFAAALAFITLDESISIIALFGVLMSVVGAYVTNKSQSNGNSSTQAGSWRSLLIALGTPVCWAISPIFIRQGLDGLDSPLLGVTIGITASVICYGIALALQGGRSSFTSISTEALTLKIIAGVLVGLSTWFRWIALDLTAIATVLAITLISIPTVNLLTPYVVDRKIEQVTMQTWFGSALIILGSLTLVLN
jgi:drug/metabolite transporter (DMT)-like permease